METRICKTCLGTLQISKQHVFIDLMFFIFDYHQRQSTCYYFVRFATAAAAAASVRFDLKRAKAQTVA